MMEPVLMTTSVEWPPFYDFLFYFPVHKPVRMYGCVG